MESSTIIQRGNGQIYDRSRKGNKKMRISSVHLCFNSRKICCDIWSPQTIFSTNNIQILLKAYYHIFIWTCLSPNQLILLHGGNLEWEELKAGPPGVLYKFTYHWSHKAVRTCTGGLDWPSRVDHGHHMLSSHPFETCSLFSGSTYEVRITCYLIIQSNKEFLKQLINTKINNRN